MWKACSWWLKDKQIFIRNWARVRRCEGGRSSSGDQRLIRNILGLLPFPVHMEFYIKKSLKGEHGGTEFRWVRSNWTPLRTLCTSSYHVAQAWTPPPSWLFDHMSPCSAPLHNYSDRWYCTRHTHSLWLTFRTSQCRHPLCYTLGIAPSGICPCLLLPHPGET